MVPARRIHVRLAIFAFAVCLNANFFDASANAQTRPDVIQPDPDRGPARVFLSVGSDVIVRLPANPGTGYMWFPRNLPRNILINPAGVVRSPPSQSPAVGGWEEQLFELKATSAGVTSIFFDYRRAYSDSPEKSVQIDVTAQ